MGVRFDPTLNRTGPYKIMSMCMAILSMVIAVLYLNYYDDMETLVETLVILAGLRCPLLTMAQMVVCLCAALMGSK